MADLLGALGDPSPGSLVPGRLATLPAATAPQPQITTLGLPEKELKRSPLDVLLDGIPFKLYIDETPERGGGTKASANEQAYTVEEVEPLLPRIGSGGLLTYADLPARDEIVLAQDNWTAGLSPVRDQTLADTYWTSVGVDARRPQQLVIQPQKFTVAQSDGSGLAGAPVRILDAFGGTYMIAGNTVYALNAGSPPSWRPVLAAGVATFTDLVAFDNVLLAAAKWPAVGGAPTITQPGTPGSTRYDYQIVPILPAGDGIPSLATSTLLGNAIVDGTNLNRLTWPAVSGATGYRVLRVFSGGTPSAVGLIATLGNVLTYDDVGGGASPYTAVSNGYYYSLDGASWTQVTGAGDAPKADLFAVVRFQLWKVVKPNKIYATTDPTNPINWNSTPTQVGDKSRNINSIAAYQVDVAIGKEDGLWTVDRSGNDFPIVPELRATADPSNCLTMKQWRSGLHFRVRNGLFRYDGGRLLSLGLDRYRAPLGPTGAPLVMNVVDTAPYNNELLCVLQAAGQPSTYIASLQESPWRWHLWGQDGRYTPTCLAVSANAFATPSLWIGQVDAAGSYSTGYIRLPAGTDNPRDDPGYVYQTGSWSITTTRLAPLPDQDKNWARLMLAAPTASAQATVSVSYAADADIETQTFTPMVGPQGQTSQYSLLQEWLFPGEIGVNARAMQFKVTLSTSDPAQSPVIRHLVAHFKHMAFPRSRFAIALICEDRPSGNSWQLDGRSAEDLYSELVRMRIVRKPVKFVGLMGDQHTVLFERLNHKLLEKQPQGRVRIIATCDLLEYLDTVTPTGPPADPI